MYVPTYDSNGGKTEDISSITAILLTRQLMLVDSDDQRKVSSLSFFEPICVGSDVSLIDLLNVFKHRGGGAHHALLIENLYDYVVASDRDLHIHITRWPLLSKHNASIGQLDWLKEDFELLTLVAHSNNNIDALHKVLVLSPDSSTRETDSKIDDSLHSLRKKDEALELPLYNAADIEKRQTFLAEGIQTLRAATDSARLHIYVSPSKIELRESIHCQAYGWESILPSLHSNVFKASLHLPTRVYHDFSSNSLEFLRSFKYHPTGFWTMPAEVSDHFKTLHTFYTVDIFVKIRLAGIQSFVEAGIERIFLNLKGFSDGQVPNGDFALSTIYPYLFEPVTQLHYQDISFPRGYKNKDFTVQWLWNAEYDVKCGGLRFTSPLEFCQSSFGDFIRHAFINSYQVNCVGSSYSDLWYIIILAYHSVPTIQLFRNLLADHAQTCPLFYDGTFCFPVGCISDYIENLLCTTLTIQLLLLL